MTQRRPMPNLAPSAVGHAVVRAQARPRSGFTLIEILIVIALIVLVLALAIPAFSFITGSRSVDAGENLVSAMLSRARAEAMLHNRVAGVAFFRDQVNGRTGMAIVVPAAQRGSLTTEPGGMEQYKAWKTKHEDGTTTVHYQPGDVVIHMVDMPEPNGGKQQAKIFVCTKEHDATNTLAPPEANHWGTLNDEELDTLVGYEYQYLPLGVGAQTINDPDPDVANPAPAGGRDRYLRSGLILFDGDGSLLHRKYVIAPPATTDTDLTHLYRIMGFDKRTLAPGKNINTVGDDPAHPVYGQLGVVLYDEENFRTAGGTNDDPLNDEVGYTANAQYNEPAEEQWLDRNALSLMVNRYNGTLVRGE